MAFRFVEHEEKDYIENLKEDIQLSLFLFPQKKKKNEY